MSTSKQWAGEGAGRASVWPSAGEWWSALRWVALVFTLLVALALAGSFFPYERVVAEGHPWLPRFHCAGCPLCGMTRAFCALSAGRWREAPGWNRGAPALYVGFWLWLAAGAAALARAGRGAGRGRAGGRGGGVGPRRPA